MTDPNKLLKKNFSWEINNLIIKSLRMKQLDNKRWRMKYLKLTNFLQFTYFKGMIIIN